MLRNFYPSRRVQNVFRLITQNYMKKDIVEFCSI